MAKQYNFDKDFYMESLQNNPWFLEGLSELEAQILENFKRAEYGDVTKLQQYKAQIEAINLVKNYLI